MTITLYFLQASRAIRIAWLLEELGLEYEVVYADRENNKGPEWFKDKMRELGHTGGMLGKSPVLTDGELVVGESGAIVEYICAKYDGSNNFIPDRTTALGVSVLQWLHAAEATFLLHALAITYARWHSPPSSSENGTIAHLEKGLSVNVQKDLDWLEEELKKGDGKYLVGGKLTAADIMMGFSVRFIIIRGLGTEGRRWEGVERWLENIEGGEGWKKAVERTGYKL